jgi:RNA polymerase sigma-70 factor (family 1)
MADLSFHSDRDLFALIATGNEPAFAELFRRYDKRIYPFVLNMIRSESQAEDITHEIFIKLWLHRSKLPHIERPDAYILTIASRHTLDHIKSNLNQAKMAQQLSYTMANASSNVTEETLLYRQSLELVEQAVERLPEQQRKVYSLSRKEGYTNDEIAHQLNISRHTVRNHLAEALRSIRRYLNDNGQVSVTAAILVILHTHN